MFRCVITKPRKEVDLDKLRELAEKGHTKEMIAAGLGMSYDALNERQNENPKIREIIREARMIPAALGVDAILEGMRKGDISAAKFFLERRCGWRNESTVHTIAHVDVKSTREGMESELRAMGIDPATLRPGPPIQEPQKLDS